MTKATRPGRASAIAVLAISAAFLAACSTSGTKPMMGKKRSKEYFSETEYGVKASPRVSNLRTNLPRGGGRDQTGRPYQVRGKWYYPKEDRNYKKVGAASWYGDAFHGRLTANGEIYDMTHLTAAHPTMPLPSYARVTNTETGASVIVRVNDRGPYAHGRIIDLSRKGAEMLGYARDGVGRVKVEYVGRAPLEGRDDQFLMASYRPGNAAPDPSDGLPTGVMIAMNGPTPNGDVKASAFPGEIIDSDQAAMMGANSMAYQDIVLPDVVPIAKPRPNGFGDGFDGEVATLGYASQSAKLSAFAAMDGDSSWKQTGKSSAPASSEYIAVGSFETPGDAKALTAKLAKFGRIEVQTTMADRKQWQTVNLYTDGRYKIDDMLRAAWSNGAQDAMTVHD